MYVRMQVTHSDSDSDTSQWMATSLRLQEKSAQLYASLSLGMKDRSQRLKERFSQFMANRKKVEKLVLTQHSNLYTSIDLYAALPPVVYALMLDLLII